MEDHSKKEEVIKQKYLEMQMLDQQLQQVLKQLQVLEQQMLELETTKEAIEEIGKTEVGEEMFVPINAGIFAKGSLKSNKELLVNVGSNVAVSKTIPEAKGLIEEQIKEIDTFYTDLTTNQQKLTAKMEELQEVAAKLVQ